MFVIAHPLYFFFLWHADECQCFFAGGEKVIFLVFFFYLCDLP